MTAPTFTSAFEHLSQRNPPPLRAGQAALTPGAAIGGRASAVMKSMSIDQFPKDFAPHHFMIIEGDLTSGAGTGLSNVPFVQDIAEDLGIPLSGLNLGQVGIGNFNRGYRLPIPMKITDAYSMVYNDNFNLLQVASKAGSLIPSPRGAGRFLGGAAGLAQDILGTQGLAVNTHRILTFGTPEFRKFQLEWNLKPKSYDESIAIQKIIMGLKQGMHPTTRAGSLGWVLSFPRIYVLYFNSGSQFLYKFKPCVLHSLGVSYTGGNPQPAFYRNQQGDAIPEGVSIHTEWIEIEIWLREHFEMTGPNDLPSNNPFTGITSAIA